MGVQGQDLQQQKKRRDEQNTPYPCEVKICQREVVAKLSIEIRKYSKRFGRVGEKWVTSNSWNWALCKHHFFGPIIGEHTLKGVKLEGKRQIEETKIWMRLPKTKSVPEPAKSYYYYR